ncbi:MAG: dihydrodipicolinate synthase family protein [Spirochaetota bacterium]
MKRIYSASITPFTENGRVDAASLEKLLEFDLERGIGGFFFLGSMGEWAVLDGQMKRDLLAAASGILRGRAEMIAGVTSTGLAGILENIEAFAKLGCDSFAVQLPGGWAKPRDPVKYLHGIADASPKPIYLYYLPQVNGITFSKEQFAELFTHPKIAGVKNSSDSLRARKELLELKRSANFLLFEGQEWTVDESLALGCDGALVGMAPLGAKLFRRIADEVEGGRMTEAAESQRTMLRIFDGIYGTDLSTVWSGQKYALRVLGIIASEKTLVPAEEQTLDTKAKQRIERCLAEFREFIV